MSEFSPAGVVIDASTGLIAVVLLISGLAKLRAPAATLDAMATLGVPAAARRRWVAVGLPVAELAVGASLLLAPGEIRWAAALAAVTMLLGFTIVVARAVAAGANGSCECFGVLSRDRLDRATVIRNIVILAAAVIATLVGPDGTSLLLTLAAHPPADLALLVAIWVACAVVATLIRWGLDRAPRGEARRAGRVGSARAASVHTPTAVGVPVGSPIPDAELVNSVGVTLPIRRLARGRAVLLIFVKVGCSACVAVARAVPEWEARIGSTVTIRVATSSRPSDVEAHYPEIGDRVRFGARGARDALGVPRLPSAVLLGSDGTVASPVVGGFAEISALVNGIAAAQSRRPADARIEADVDPQR